MKFSNIADFSVSKNYLILCVCGGFNYGNVLNTATPFYYDTVSTTNNTRKFINLRNPDVTFY